MTLLVDWQIQEALRTGELIIHGLGEDAIQPASVDVHLGSRLYFPSITRDTNITREHWAGYPFMRGTFALGHTEEFVSLPPTMAAQISGKSTLARQGLIVESAGWIDPGFEGQLTLEMYMLDTLPILLKAGMAIAQLTFFRTEAARQPYSKDHNHYQGQRGPTPAYQEDL